MAYLRGQSRQDLDDDIARFMEEGSARRQARGAAAGVVQADGYELSLWVIGRYIDQQKPRTSSGC